MSVHGSWLLFFEGATDERQNKNIRGYSSCIITFRLLCIGVIGCHIASSKPKNFISYILSNALTMPRTSEREREWERAAGITVYRCMEHSTLALFISVYSRFPFEKKRNIWLDLFIIASPMCRAHMLRREISQINFVFNWMSNVFQSPLSLLFRASIPLKSKLLPSREMRCLWHSLYKLPSSACAWKYTLCSRQEQYSTIATGGITPWHLINWPWLYL